MFTVAPWCVCVINAGPSKLIFYCVFFIRAVSLTQAISTKHISRWCMVMRCVEILRSIDGCTSCTAVQPYGTAVEVIMLHSGRAFFAFCEPQIYDFFCSIFREKAETFNHMNLSGNSGTLVVN